MKHPIKLIMSTILLSENFIENFSDSHIGIFDSCLDNFNHVLVHKLKILRIKLMNLIFIVKIKSAVIKRGGNHRIKNAGEMSGAYSAELAINPFRKTEKFFWEIGEKHRSSKSSRDSVIDF